MGEESVARDCSATPRVDGKSLQSETLVSLIARGCHEMTPKIKIKVLGAATLPWANQKFLVPVKYGPGKIVGGAAKLP